MQAILQVLSDYRDAVHAKDVDAFIALYDDNIRVFDAWNVWSYEGSRAWREMATGWFASLGSERVRVEMSDVRVDSSGDLATASAFVKYVGVSEHGADLRSLENRITMTLKRRDDRWKIVHEHTSAPANHETLAVSLRRP